MSKRVYQTTAVNRTIKKLGGVVIECCNKCNRFMITICQETGEKIKFPLSGPIPESCPLPNGRSDADEIGPSETLRQEQGEQ